METRAAKRRRIQEDERYASARDDAFEVLRQWTWVNSMERYRPPPLAPATFTYQEGSHDTFRSPSFFHLIGRPRYHRQRLDEEGRSLPATSRDPRYQYDYPQLQPTTLLESLQNAGLFGQAVVRNAWNKVGNLYGSIENYPTYLYRSRSPPPSE